MTLRFVWIFVVFIRCSQNAMVTDPIADFLIHLKNVGRARRATASIAYSKAKEAIAKLLLHEGYLTKVETKGKKVGHKILELELAYPTKGVCKVTEVARISKPGRRVYASASELPYARRGIIVVSTSSGLCTTRQAKAKKLGGEVLFSIW